jgi:hypothetical protein
MLSIELRSHSNAFVEYDLFFQAVKFDICSGPNIYLPG